MKEKREIQQLRAKIEDRISVLEMLLWKNHIEGIPTEIGDRLVENGWLKHIAHSYEWSNKAIELSLKFNKCFEYE